MPDGPAACLDLVAVLEASGALCDYHLLAATHAGLLRRLGRLAEAGASYRRPWTWQAPMPGADSSLAVSPKPKPSDPGHCGGGMLAASAASCRK